MRISFNPPRARIVAVVIGAWMLWRLIHEYTIQGSVNLHLPPLQPIHEIGALAVIGLVIVGLARLYVNNR